MISFGQALMVLLGITLVMLIVSCIVEDKLSEKELLANDEHDKKAGKVLFICDKTACGESCPTPECRHTSDIHHARHFEDLSALYGDSVGYVEIERIGDD